MSDQRAAAVKAFLDHPLVRIPAGVVVSVMLGLAVWFGQRSVTALDKMEADITALSTSLTRLETLYQTQVPNLADRLETTEKDLRLLQWKMEMQDYHRVKAEEDSEREERRRDRAYARPARR